jgi:leucine dehydrogenase
MKACAEEVFGSPSLEGRTVAVQGLGHVGWHLCEMLHNEGASLFVTDLGEEVVEQARRKFGAKPVGLDEILSIPCDILAPCALGAVVNDTSLPNLRCSVIAGSANNILFEPRHGEALAERDILYAPDYVINAGGLINVADELEGYNEKRATKRVMRIYDSMKSIIAIAKRDGVPTHVAADTLALERIDAISSIERLHTGHPYGLERRRRETL